ncbi:unnamed protein product [Phytophthora fragariaefolia]|uniref:Unnamed protein product n=1 Tax=Phytophthora fragariaefolia TaxID=1490495 RepID=A0A9W6Y3A0_9STRA|nr:unnamed protein product [Phytophthora fragariaefolia]
MLLSGVWGWFIPKSHSHLTTQGAMARSAPGSDVGHGDAALAVSGGTAAQGEPVDDRQERAAAPEAMQCDSTSTYAPYLSDEGVEEEELLLLCLLLVAVVVALSQIDGRSIRRPAGKVIVVRSDFFSRLKANSSLKAYRRTVCCSPESFDKLQALLGPLYYRTGYPVKTRSGDGIGGAANQLGMSRTPALRYIQKLEELLYGMMNDVVYFPGPTADAEWDDMVDGFAARGGDFRDVAYNYHLSSTRIFVECVFGKLKARFKVIHGVAYQRSHTANVRMICVAVFLHNPLVDIGDKEEFDYTLNDDEREQARVVMNQYNQYWDKTQAEDELAERKRDSYASYFYGYDAEE